MSRPLLSDSRPTTTAPAGQPRPVTNPVTGLIRRLTSNPPRVPSWRQLVRPATFWLVTVTVALITAGIVDRASAPYPQEWGPSVTVVVAAAPLQPGDRITDSSVVVRSVPSAFVPRRPAHSTREAVGRVAVNAVPVGAPVDLALTDPTSTSAVATAVRPGRLGVSLPIDAAPLGVSAGDHVDVVVARDGDGQVLAQVRDVVVAMVGERAVLVSVLPADATTLTSARQLGQPTLLLRGG